MAILQSVINSVGALLDIFLDLLPDSPFVFDSPVWPEWIESVGVIIPIPGMIAHMTAYITAVLAYVIIRIVLRWLKAIQ